MRQSLPWMESVDAKLARATEHFETYNNEAKRFVDSVERNFALKENPQTGARWLVFWETNQTPPLRLSAIAGDVLFNLRCALDHLICGLNRRVAASDSCEEFAFPVCTKPEFFEKSARKLGVIPAEAIRVIRAVQPFHEPENSVRLHPLWLLRDLNDLDKHRMVHTGLGVSSPAHVTFFSEAGQEVHRILIPRNDNLGPVIIDLPTTLPHRMRLQARGSFSIMFRAYPALAGRAVDEVLATCMRFVELKVIDELKPFFREST